MNVKDVVKFKVVIFVKDGAVRIMHSRKVKINIPGKRMYYCHHSSHTIYDAPTFDDMDGYIKHLVEDHGDEEAKKIIGSFSDR